MKKSVHTTRRIQGTKSTNRLSTLQRLRRSWSRVALIIIVGGIALTAIIVILANGQQASSGNATNSPATSASQPASPSSSTPEAQPTTQTGIFSLSSGFPLPVSANVLHPTNMARLINHNIQTNIYAGSMTTNPNVGALFVLQENLLTGDQTTHLYQTSKPVGPLTIITVHGNILTCSTPTGTVTFDITSGVFHL